VISVFCHKVDENCVLLGHYTVGSDNSLSVFQVNCGCVITQKNAVHTFLSELFFFQEKILEELQTVHQQMCSVGKLEKLQNTNKMPLFLTWPSEKYGKLLLCKLSVLNKSHFLMNDLPCPEAGHPDCFKLFHVFQKILLAQQLTLLFSLLLLLSHPHFSYVRCPILLWNENENKHAGPEAKGSNPTTGLTLLWAHNPSRGNFNHRQVSRKEAGQIFFK